ncbi:MAG TPA: serine/threonine-protein kinase [Candidatus Dormibacteraeota bacterium]|nr:serine/threonine-protein kinase [Candidatus Dormibacteraeota bacterium]
MPIGPGTKLGQYEVQDFIGQGAMGFVYRAYHAQLERTGAVKVLQAIAPDPDTTARFRHEAQAIAQMRHPNILNVYDFGEYQGTPYMIVEYVPGGSLADRLSQGILDQPTAIKYLRGVAAGLDHAHAQGIVHRDVKPANVLLERDDTPVLADFGLAKLLQGSSLKSMTGVTTGTPAYMSPEQVSGSQVGPAADRYSLATIAYEMLTGMIPFDGVGVLEILYAQVHREPPPPSTRIRRLNSRVDAVIMRGLAKKPADRWDTCTAFVEALAEALDRKSAAPPARTVVMMPRPAPTAAPVEATMMAPPAYVDESERVDQTDAGETIAVAYPSPPPPVIKKRSRKGLFAIVAAATLVLLLVAGTVGYIATHQKLAVSVSPSTVAAGDAVLVTASHLPANQIGEIRLFSPVHTFPFHADSSGNVRAMITIPPDIGIGDHTVHICWASVCRVSATLHVLEPVPVVTPSPTSPPSPSPTPTPAPKPVVTLLSISASGSFTVRLQNFTVGTPAALVVFEKDTPHFAGNVTVTSSDFRATVRTPPGVQPNLPAYVVACNNVNGPCDTSPPVTTTS